MQVHPVRGLVLGLSIACALLSACARPSHPRSAGQIGSCEMPGGWHFEGACANVHVPSSGTRIALPAYRGIGVTVAFGPSDGLDGSFVIGDATGNGDIAGKLNGVHPFPPFGRAGCLTAGGTQTPCRGHAVIYLLVINVGNLPVNFMSSPQIVVTSPMAFAGAQRCRLNTLAIVSRPRREPIYRQSAAFATPSHGKVIIPSIPALQHFESGGQFTVYAISCDHRTLRRSSL
jgi:hypothetical protein